MFIAQVSGKLSLLKTIKDPESEMNVSFVTLTERRWTSGGEEFLKHYLRLPDYLFNFTKKCIEKDWKVVVTIEDPIAYRDQEYTDAGYVLYATAKSIQIP